MAMLLAQGTGARWAQVWLNVSGRLTLAATWPADADADGRPRALRRGARRCHRRRAGGPWPVRARRPAAGGAPAPGATRPGADRGRGAALRRAGRPGRAGAAAGRAAGRARGPSRASWWRGPRSSRRRDERLIETQDAERRRLERDIHDGAQQHLVALTVNLRLAQTIAARSPERAAACSPSRPTRRTVAIETLSSLSRGIYPRLLADEGLVPALRSAVAASAIPVTIDADGAGRLPAPVEAALYFCCMEAVQNAAKHSGASTRDGAAGRGRATMAAHRHRRRRRLRPGSQPLTAPGRAWSTCATGWTRSAGR